MKYGLFKEDRMIRYWKDLTSDQKDEQLQLWDKSYKEFLWDRADRITNSIAMNRAYKWSDESWYAFIKRIKIK